MLQKNSVILFCIISLFSLTTIAQELVLPEAKCQKGRFAPCVCVEEVPTEISYIPSLSSCSGAAAVVTRGQFVNFFSVVVRDSENRDRFPSQGFNGCSKRLANSKNPPNRCSAFKVQKTFFQDNNGVTERVDCLGADGNSKLFKKVRRATFKLQDIPNSNQDPLLRVCLPKQGVQLN